MLAMEASDNEGYLNARGALRFFASMLAPTGVVFWMMQKNAPNQSGRQMCSAAVSFPSGPQRLSTQEADQWNCSSSVEPVSAVTEDEPPWITVVMSSK